MPNRLASETSPYLLQHKDNPVDWYPWGPEALGRAKAEDKPILLSIGYSACHWCHVMERESFEDPDTAEVMNALFVSIKVDREERPDLDGIYMQAVQALTGHGGWPMTVFLTPDGRPFFGGTYFPKAGRPGMPAFVDLLKAVGDAYHNRKGEVLQSASQIAQHLQGRSFGDSGLASPGGGSQQMLTEALLTGALQRLAAAFDWDHGGFGSAPKFPQPMGLEFLLRSYKRQPDPRLLQMAEHTLTQMARGGMYDQAGGGFHRYSTDAHWLAPHFEKMLYDNALLSQVYLHAWQVTGSGFYRQIAEETYDYVLREMTHAAGGFYSAQDADSEGEEGKFFLWSPEEVREVLGDKEGRLFCAYFDVTEEGNFEGRSILNVPVAMAQAAQNLGVPEERLREVAERGRKALYAARGRRVHPGRDEKALTAWNGLMLRSFSEAAPALGRQDYLNAAVRNAEFLLGNLRKDGRILRTWKEGQAKLLGYLEDYAMLADGLLALHAATSERRWLDEARSLADAMADLFWDEGKGFFYDTGKDHEQLVVRPRDTFDNAMPCGGSVAADVLLRLAVITGEPEYARKATASMRSVAALMTQYPTGFAHWLGALDFYLSKPVEIALVGARHDPAMGALAQVVFEAYLPNKVVAGWAPNDPTAHPEPSAASPEAWRRTYPVEGRAVGGVKSAETPLLKGRGLVGGRPAAYVCENYACQLPATEPGTLRKQLGI